MVIVGIFGLIDLSVLIDSEECHAPALDHKINLKNAGLGKAEISFQKDGNAEHFHETILDIFPKLKDCGGCTKFFEQ